MSRILKDVMISVERDEFKALCEGTWEPSRMPGGPESLLPSGCVLGPRVLVCGGRDYTNRQRLVAVLDEMHECCPIRWIIEGEASGNVNADKMARLWAEYRGIGVLPFPADWDGLGSAAGPRRNLQMLAEGRPDVVVAFPGDRGTRDMLKQAKSFGYPTIDLRYEAYRWAGSL